MLYAGMNLRIILNTTEQELINLLILKNPEETYRFIRQMSSSRPDREALINSILQDDIFNMEKIEEVDGHETHTMTILNSYLTTIGIKLVQ
jgi:hypothetical protein